jgi:hypothetical protein
MRTSLEQMRSVSFFRALRDRLRPPRGRSAGRIPQICGDRLRVERRASTQAASLRRRERLRCHGERRASCVCRAPTRGGDGKREQQQTDREDGASRPLSPPPAGPAAGHHLGEASMQGGGRAAISPLVFV